MIKFHSIGQVEHAYPFEDAFIVKETLNGTFGTVANTKFEAAANASKAIMQIENGDDAGMPEYKIPQYARVRVLDLEKLAGQVVEVYDYPLPAFCSTGDKLVSDAEGKLVVDNGATGLHLEVTKIIGQYQGVEAKVIAASA